MREDLSHADSFRHSRLRTTEPARADLTVMSDKQTAEAEETSQSPQRGNCVCCREAVDLWLIADERHPRGQWLDDQGRPHIGIGKVLRQP